MDKKKASTPIERAKQLFRKHGGMLRTNQAIALGVHPRDLYWMRDQGVIEPLNRGLYRLKEMLPSKDIDLISVSSHIPQGVISLISALAFHGLTTQIPHEVFVALKKGMEKPRLRYPPIRCFWLSEPSFSEGIEVHRMQSFSVRIYNPEKTLADCFKFRRKIGFDVALEALRNWRKKRGSDIKKLMYYAQVCRVEKIISPYLEALL